MGKTNVEYATDQITVYPTCPFRCRYCWASTALMRYRTRNPKPIEEALKLAKSRRPRIVVVSFTVDPYQPCEEKTRTTREVLQLLRTNPLLTVMVLTKNTLVERDFDLLLHPNFWLGMTVTSLDKIPDEPYAPPNPDRIMTLKKAHDLGINTAMSIEPWIPKVTNPLEIIEATYQFVDWYVIGRLDYETQFGYQKISRGFYQQSLWVTLKLLRSLGFSPACFPTPKGYHIKKQLLQRP